MPASFAANASAAVVEVNSRSNLALASCHLNGPAMLMSPAWNIISLIQRENSWSLQTRGRHAAEYARTLTLLHIGTIVPFQHNAAHAVSPQQVPHRQAGNPRSNHHDISDLNTDGFRHLATTHRTSWCGKRTPGQTRQKSSS